MQISIIGNNNYSNNNEDLKKYTNSLKYENNRLKYEWKEIDSGSVSSRVPVVVRETEGAVDGWERQHGGQEWWGRGCRCL